MTIDICVSGKTIHRLAEIRPKSSPRRAGVIVFKDIPDQKALTTVTAIRQFCDNYYRQQGPLLHHHSR